MLVCESYYVFGFLRTGALSALLPQQVPRVAQAEPGHFGSAIAASISVRSAEHLRHVKMIGPRSSSFSGDTQ